MEEEVEFPTVEAGQWVKPVRKGYRMMCCDCGLVHVLNFKLVKVGRGHHILMQAFREDER